MVCALEGAEKAAKDETAARTPVTETTSHRFVMIPSIAVSTVTVTAKDQR
jgi:hypothetical protein